MIHEEICTYEVCKLAKEKGFPQDVFGTCEMKSSCYLEDGRFYKDGCIYPIENAYTAPTQSLLQRWLRENHGADVWVDTAATMDPKNQRCYYWHIAYDSDGSCIYILDSMLSCPTYEKALEEGLKEAIIEFVEEKR